MACVLKVFPRIAFAAALASAGPAFAGSMSAGAQAFQAQCSICHRTAGKAQAAVGPDLFGVVGRKAGSQQGYAYSAAMKHSGLIWTPDELKLYLTNPQKVVPGNKMPFPGLHDSTRLDAVLSYLETLK